MTVICRSARKVPKGETDKLLTDDIVEHTLVRLFTALHGGLKHKHPTNTNQQFNNQTQSHKVLMDIIPKSCDERQCRNNNVSLILDVKQGEFTLNRHLMAYNVQGHQQEIESSLTWSQAADSGWSDFKLANKRQYGLAEAAAVGLREMRRCLGFTIEKSQSVMPGGGTGVMVTSGMVPKGTVVAMYPGLNSIIVYPHLALAMLPGVALLLSCIQV